MAWEHVIERLVAWLSYSRLRVLSRVFAGGPRLYLESDPVEQDRIIRAVERSVYGEAGLDAYERAESRPLARAARRSLAQHLGQRAQYPRLGERVARRSAFALLTPLLLIYLLFASWRGWRSAGAAGDRGKVVIFFWAQRLDKFVWAGMFGTRPFLLHTEQQVYLGRREIGFVVRALFATPRALAYPEFLSNLLRWTAYYGFVRRRYEPTLVAHFFESTASSSLMTAYLNEYGIEHCDIQHGELRFTAHCAFTEFDQYRVWGAHFNDLLARQRSPRDRVTVVGVPFHRDLFNRVRPSQQPRPRRLLIIDAFMHDEWSHDTHFLRVLRALDRQWEVRVRRHPADRQAELACVRRWNTDPELRRRGVTAEEERPADMPIADALARSRIVAGVSSAALLEAWIAGCKVLYVPGGPARDAVIERHCGSPNVAHLDDDFDLAHFLDSPACLDGIEAGRVNNLSLVLVDER